MRTRLLAVIGLLAASLCSEAAIAPAITVQPASQAATLGSSVTFLVTASGTPPLHYQWARNGNDLTDRTNVSLALTALSSADTGGYTVVITNSMGAITSQVARLELVSGFTRVTDSVLGRSGQPLGAAWGDFNNDGWVDLFMASSSYLIYTNRGDGTFQTLSTTILAGDSSGGRVGAAWADFDNDGHLDLAVAGNSGGPLYLYRNLGNGTNFARVTSNIFNGPGLQMFTPAWGDYDNDGFVDLFLAVSPSGASGNDLLFHNNGDGTFARITNSILVRDGTFSQSAIWGDFDNDGDLDLYTTEPNASRNALYRNDGGGNFALVTNSPIATDSGNSAGGCVWGDFDNDGDLDLFVTSFSANAYFYRNDGNGLFTRTLDSIVAQDGPSAGCTALDFDNDGWLDLVSPGPKNLLYHNNRDGTFTKVTTGDVVAQPVVSWGNNSFAVADVNRDGFPDLLWVDYNGNSQFFRNEGNSNNWLTVRCAGRMSNRAGIGAKVRLKATLAGQVIWQMREISGGGLVFAQNEMTAAFGLGDATSADVIRVEWPSGLVQELRDVATKQFLTVIEPEAQITPARVQVEAGTSVTLVLTTTLPPPLSLQWQRDGAALPGETNATLLITNMQAGHLGSYAVVVADPAGGFSFTPPPATLSGAVSITQHPLSQKIPSASNVTFRVSASGVGRLSYQWQFNGAPLFGATNDTLTLTNVLLSQEGTYQVAVSNSYGGAMSGNATLLILIKPIITWQPASQSVVAGGSATFSISISGHPPPFGFRWRKNAVSVTNIVLNGTTCFFTVTNIQPAGPTNVLSYTVAVTNAAGNILSSTALLTLLPDTDGDGLPDDWETAHGFDPANATDAALDADGDGVTNLQEYLAGTDPQDALSMMRIERIDWSSTAGIELCFTARSNKTYTVESCPRVEGASWNRIADVPAASTNRTVMVNDPAQPTGPEQRFYRLISPRVP